MSEETLRRSGRFWAQESFPKDNRAILDRVFEVCHEWEWLLPSWVQRVWLAWEPGGSTTGLVISVHVMPEYRWAKLSFYPVWLSNDRDEQASCIVHEFLHFTVNPAVDYAWEVIERVFSDGAENFKATIKEGIRVRVEGAICDLEYQIMEKLGREPSVPMRTGPEGAVARGGLPSSPEPIRLLGDAGGPPIVIPPGKG